MQAGMYTHNVHLFSDTDQLKMTVLCTVAFWWTLAG